MIVGDNSDENINIEVGPLQKVLRISWCQTNTISHKQAAIFQLRSIL